MVEIWFLPLVKKTDLCSLQCFKSICVISDLFFPEELKLNCLITTFASGKDNRSRAVSKSILSNPESKSTNHVKRYEKSK